MDTISLMLHLLFAALLVGPMLLLAVAVTPSTWLIEDEGLRRAVTRVVTRRYAFTAAVSLVGLLVTGLYQFYSLVPDAIQEEMLDFRFGLIFVVKMTNFVLLVGLIAAHAMYFGPRIRRASEAVERGEAEAWVLEQQRRNALLLSLLMTVVGLGLLFLGAALGHHEYSYVAR